MELAKHCIFSLCLSAIVYDSDVNKKIYGDCHYNPFLVYCRELAPSTVSLTGDWAQGDDRKHDSHYSINELKSYKLQGSLWVDLEKT